METQEQAFDTSKIRIVLLCGHAGAGKDTVADTLVQYAGFSKRRFAGPLYAMLSRMFGISVLDLEDMKRKNTCLPETNVTVRHALQTLGTEWGRNCIDNGIWVNLLLREIVNHAKQCAEYKGSAARPWYVIPDCRFDNEFYGIIARAASYPGLCAPISVAVNRNGAEGIYMSHESEANVSFLKSQCLYTIDNNTALNDCHTATKALYRQWHDTGWLYG